jgi:hypothetical protein
MPTRLSRNERNAVAKRIFAVLCAHYPKHYVALIEPKAPPRARSLRDRGLDGGGSRPQSAVAWSIRSGLNQTLAASAKCGGKSMRRYGGRDLLVVMNSVSKAAEYCVRDHYGSASAGQHLVNKGDATPSRRER